MELNEGYYAMLQFAFFKACLVPGAIAIRHSNKEKWGRKNITSDSGRDGLFTALTDIRDCQIGSWNSC